MRRKAAFSLRTGNFMSDSSLSASGSLHADLDAPDLFAGRHIAPDAAEIAAMLKRVGRPDLDSLIDATVPPAIRLTGAAENLDIPSVEDETAFLRLAREVSDENQRWLSALGTGYYGTITPPVIQRNVLENPGWYTQYMPYQAEIAQGRLEALLNYQTMVSDLTALPLANASLLDEATAAAEAMAMCHAIAEHQKPKFVASADCHPQTLAVVATRARSMGIKLVISEIA